MTERFILKHFESMDWIYDNGTYIDALIIVELLNDFDKECMELREENKMLKTNIKKLIEDNRYLRKL